MTSTPVSAFEAAASACPPVDMWIAVAGCQIHIQVAGPRLAGQILAPMRHIEIEAPSAPPGLLIQAWSVEETGVPSAPGFDCEWIAPEGTRVLACLPGPERLARQALTRPFQKALVRMLARRGLITVHAGLVSAPEGAGLLVVGPNGSGKSTTCLAAALAGMRMVGDDLLILERAGERFIGHSLYCSCSLTEASRAMLPPLPEPLLRPFDAPSGAKAVLILPARGPQSPMQAAMDIGGLVFPVVTGGPDTTRMVPITPMDTYRRFMTTIRFLRHLDQNQRQEPYAALAALALARAGFRLDLGTDADAIPGVLAALSRSQA